MFLCPSDASSDTNTYFCHLSHDSSRTARYLDADNSLSPFSSCHSSVTSRMHCYFPCLLLFRIFLFFPSSTEQWPFCAQLCRLHDFGTMWVAYLCVCVHTPAYAMYFIAVNHWLILSSRFFPAVSWLTTLGQHVRDLLPPLFTVSFFLPLLDIFTVLFSTPHKM